ncbi:hypothetical protein HDU92_003851 [Lobulomyces angularis]|nr:hypothetical protein HDU92_003851 [Lobulomyces angularis]
MNSKHNHAGSTSSLNQNLLAKKKDFDTQSIFSLKSVSNLSQYNTKSNFGSRRNLNNSSQFSGSSGRLGGSAQALNFNDNESNYSYSSGKKRSGSLANVGVNQRDPTFLGIIRPKFIKREESEVFCVKFSPSNEFILVGLGNGNIQVYSTKTNGIVNTLANFSPEVDGVKLPVNCFSFRPERKEFKHGNVVVAGYTDGKLVHWHYPTGQRLSVIDENDNQIFTCQYNQIGSLLASGGANSYISIYDGITQKFQYRLIYGKPETTAGHSNRIFSIKFHPTDLNILLSAGWDNTVQIWDIKSRVSIRSIFSPHVCGDSIDIDFSGNFLLTGSYRKHDSIQVWSISTGKLVRTIPWSILETSSQDKNCLLYSCHFSKAIVSKEEQQHASKEKNNMENSSINLNHYIIAGGGCSSANEVRLFDNESGKCLGIIQNILNTVYSTDISSNERMLAFGGASRALYVYDIDPNLVTEFLY